MSEYGEFLKSKDIIELRYAKSQADRLTDTAWPDFAMAADAVSPVLHGYARPKRPQRNRRSTISWAS